MHERRSEIAVVGGGLVGLAAATALARHGVEVMHLAPTAPPDRRTSALMMPSVRWLQEAGLVADPAAIGHRLGRIRIIDMTNRLIRAPETLFDSAEAGLPAFGWNFPNMRLAEVFAAVSATIGLVTVATGATALSRTSNGWRIALADGGSVETALVVGADGKRSTVRGAGQFTTRDSRLGEAALVADLRLGRPLGETSVEFHYPRGPFTLVPAGEDRANLVWIDDPAVLARARDGGEEALLAALRERSCGLFGAISLASPSAIFPLSILSASPAGMEGLALVGEAAHAFPPIGAQGLNLGLRDVADLVDAVLARDRAEAGWAEAASRAYAERRATDLVRTSTMVEGLYRSLVAGMLPAQALRAGGLWALKSLPFLRRQAFSLGMGGSGKA
ncbi:2-octaprenyl-6-methoxyphenol hydroxylase [Devosia enhydra]|uniref:2-octaprenyl-6-methoxyphenol hydroxylase n=1 Tax=Devosia enhydra TaxID=665118 RepID=A0A1K2HUD6_9HYPH|nr:FAD-dependent monooxygenase [Devosia enhydra]SFZ82021.1 2-octaprenyl-6-methoxyphenol hydroxylase [Devosia enhydra]